MKELQGDLFTSTDNLCHCVSADMVMGKGIATEFKKRWGVPTTLSDGTSVQGRGWKIGDVGVIDDGKRKILYLVTKDKYWEKPTYESLNTCLWKVSQMKLSSLSMPRIGCGLDKLQWDLVSQIIRDIAYDIDITVYSL